MVASRIKRMFRVFKNAIKGFSNDKVPKLSGSLAYSTVFSMGPLLIVIISLCSIFLGKDAIEGKIYQQLSGLLGADTALQLQQIIKSASLHGKTHVAIVIGIITLIVGATAIFSEIQDSVNMIWGLKPKPGKGLIKLLKNRFLSFSIVVSLSFLLLVSLGISTVIDGFSDQLKQHFPDIAVVVFYIINSLFTLFVTALIFAVIFRVLPDARIKWKDVLVGAVITAVLFMLGKFGISFYISKSQVGTTYGIAGSLVVLLLWVYYSSLILYFGAEITRAYAMEFGDDIFPNDYAVTTKTVEVERGGEAVT